MLTILERQTGWLTISDAIELLRESPTMGIPQFALLPGLYCKPVHKSYLIFYIAREDNNLVSILRVLHGARDWEIYFH